MVPGLSGLPVSTPGGYLAPWDLPLPPPAGACSPGTMLGEAKGTAWPESCWSLVTWAKEEGSEVRGGLNGEGVPWAVATHLSWGHSPILTLDGKALWGESG